tara:strand:- start:377 stop:679 length:303 start_codon:yes stop_codon:yes gene_type:complete
MTIKFRKNLGKKEISKNINSTIGLSSNNIKKISDEIIQIVTDILINQKKINIKNFGSFKIDHKKERLGRNPKTKEEFIINERNVIKFKLSNYLKQKINDI